MTTSTAAWEALHRAQIMTARQFHARPEFRTVSFREYDLLDVLSGVDELGLRLHQLNQHLPITQSSLSRMVDRLEARGYVYSWVDPADLRGLRIRLTVDGRAVHAHISTAHHAHVQGIMSTALTPEEQAVLARLATKLHTAT